MQRLASIDIGSQTIRLLIADIGSGTKLLPVLKDRAIIRLGQGVQEKSVLDRQAIDRAIDCISGFIAQARSLGCSSIYAEATACVRTASNRDALLQGVYTATGILPRVLSGDEEARTSVAGVLSAIKGPTKTMIIVDIGGGSTEIITINENRIEQAISVPMGVIGLTEHTMLHDPPLAAEIALLRSHIKSYLGEYGIQGKLFTDAETLVGTAGTVTTLAAMDMRMTRYDEDRINGYYLTRQAVERIYTDMLALSVEQRTRLPGLEKGRAAVIPAGAAIVLEVLASVNKKQLQVSDAGLLEGIMLKNLQ